MVNLEENNMKKGGRMVKIYGLKINAYLWSCPDLPHWKRLILAWFYIPYLIICFLRGTPVLIGKWENCKKDGKYIQYR